MESASEPTTAGAGAEGFGGGSGIGPGSGIGARGGEAALPTRIFNSGEL